MNFSPTKGRLKSETTKIAPFEGKNNELMQIYLVILKLPIADFTDYETIWKGLTVNIHNFMHPAPLRNEFISAMDNRLN